MLDEHLAEEIEGREIPSVEFAGRTQTDVPFGPADLGLASGLLGVELGGLLGYSAFADLALGLDYQEGRVWALDGWTEDQDVGAHVVPPFAELPFELISSAIILAPAQVEGLEGERFFIVDTGTSSAMISRELYEEIDPAGDGRTVLMGSKLIFSSGEADSPIFRLRSFAMGGVAASKMWTSVAPPDFFVALSVAAGVEVEGIVGGTYLRELFTVIDYPNRALRIASYADGSHVSNDFRMVGVEVVRQDEQYSVYTVFEGSDAEAQGVAVGDVLVSLDGQPAAEMDHVDVLALLHGEVGTTLAMTLSHEGQEYSVEVSREDLLPDL